MIKRAPLLSVLLLLANPGAAQGLPSLSRDLIWVPVTVSVTIEELASQLLIDESQLARLNNVQEDHHFDEGEWVALPARNAAGLSQIASLDGTSARSIPPQQVRRIPLTSSGVIRFGDTVADIARRYGMTIAELLRLNPGLETARLVVGAQVRLAQSAPLPKIRPVLGLNPVGSGGTSWPETPQRFDRSPGVSAQVHLSPDENVRIRRDLPMSDRVLREACMSGSLSVGECRRRLGFRGSSFGTDAAPLPPINRPLSSREQALLERIRQQSQPIWRRFGTCQYNWNGWKLQRSGVRTTTYKCDNSEIVGDIVGVSCGKLTINSYGLSTPLGHAPERRAWGTWRQPWTNGEDEMVAALCAHTVN